MMPKVSVIMSVYNCEKYVACAMDSILSQSYSDFEFIVINDGSTDNTSSIVLSYKDKRIIYHEQDNIGLTKSLNKGIKMSNGEYIARIDADDYSMPKRLEKQVMYLDNNKEVALLGTSYCMYNVKSGWLEYISHTMTHDQIKKYMVIRGTPFRHSSVMFRRSVVNEIGPYNEKCMQAQDYEYWLRIANSYNVAIMSEYLCISRRNISDSIVAKRSQFKHAKITYEYKMKAMELYGYSVRDHFMVYIYTALNLIPQKIIPETTLYFFRRIFDKRRFVNKNNVNNDIKQAVEIITKY